MTQLKEDGICRIFYSSPFNGMEGEREDLTKTYWPRIQALCNSRGVQFVPVDMRWGITTELSDNNQTINICLREIDRSDIFIGFFGQRYGWHGENDEVLQRSFDAAVSNFPWIDDQRGKSVTELEFLHGHLNHPDKTPAVFCFRNKAWDDKHREEGIAQGNKKTVYKYSSESDHATDLLTDLKARVKATENKLLALNMEYDTPEEGARVMSECVLEYLDQVLLKKSGLTQQSGRQQELEEHDAFCNTRTAFYIQPKHQPISRLNTLISKESGGVVLVTGAPGSGKTALLSSWLQKLKDEHYGNNDCVLAYHFVGSTQASSDVLNLLSRLIKEVAIHGASAQHKAPEEYAENLCKDLDAAQSARQFKDVLKQARTKGKKVIVIIDGLDKIKHEMKTTKPVFWLPEPIPDGVQFVLATQTHNTGHIETLREGWNTQLEEVEVTALDTDSQKLMCQEGLKLRGKELSPSQMEVVLNSEGAKNPLFLKIVLEELCMFGKFRELDKKIQSLVSCNSSEELFYLYLERMEQDYNSKDYTGNLIEEVMCALYVSRHGLSEAEIMASLDIAPHLWSPVYFGMQHYIITRKGFMSIADDGLKQAILKKYIKSDEERVKYFAKQKEYYKDVLLGKMADGASGVAEFRVVIEALYTAYMSRDFVFVWRLITAPSTLTALANTTSRSDLLSYIQGMGISQERLVDVYVKEFKKYMVKEYCEQMEDLIYQPNVVREYVQKLQILNKFLEFAHYHTAAEVVLLKILEVQEKNPNIYEDTTETEGRLARIYIDMKNPDKSLPLQQKCVQAAEKKQDSGKEEDLETLAMYYHGLGLAHLGLLQTELAREYFRKSIDFHRKTSLERFPEREMHVKKSLSSIAQSFCDEGQYEESLKLYQQVVQLEKELYFGEVTEEQSYTLSNMGIVCRKLGKFDEAELYYNKALQIKQNVYEGMLHFDLAIAYGSLGNLAKDRQDYPKAEENFRKAYQVMESLEMTGEATAVSIKDNLLLVMLQQEKFAEMLPLYWPDFYRLLIDNHWFNHSYLDVHYTMANYMAYQCGMPKEACEVLIHVIQSRVVRPDFFLYLDAINVQVLSKDGEVKPLPHEQSLDRCIEMYPDYLQAREQKVKLHLAPQKDIDGIVKTLEEYYELVGYTEDKLLVLCAQHCVSAGWPEGALQLYKCFSHKFTGEESSQVILRNMAVLYANNGDYKAAIQCFEELTQKFPDVWLFPDLIVRTYMNMEDWSMARESAQVLAQKFPDDEAVVEKVKAYTDQLDKIDEYLASQKDENNAAEN